MSENPKKKCPYCSQSIFCSVLGNHILKLHEAELFQDNSLRKKLTSDYYHHPIPITLDNNRYNLCLCCNKLVTNPKYALKHFTQPDCLKCVKDKIDSLSKKYPPCANKVTNTNIDISGSVINNTTVNLTLPNNLDTKEIKELIIDLLRIADVNSKISFDIDQKLYKATKRGIITKEQQEALDELSDITDDDLIKPDPVIKNPRIRKRLAKLPQIDPTL